MWLKLLDKLQNDFHVPIAIMVFVVTSTYHFYTHQDLGTQYTNSIYALYAFLGGHAWSCAKYSGDSNAPANASANS